MGNIVNNIKDGITNAGEKAKEVLNKFIDVIAIFIIAYCVIPIIVVLMVIWFIKFLFGIKIPVPNIKKIKTLKPANQLDNKQDILEV